MGLLDIAANVLTTVKADTSDAKAKIKELKGEEQELAKAQLEQANARNDQLEDWVKHLGKVAIALAAAKEAADFVWDAYKLKQHETRLEIAATGIDVEALGEKFGGLKTHMELLEFAQRANASAFKLTNEQLQEVAQAIRIFTERGFDANKVQEDFTNFMITGRSKALAPYGIQLHGLGETMDNVADKVTPFSKRLASVHEGMEQIGALAKDGSTALGQFGEDADRASVSLKDAWEETKMQFADMGQELVPLVEALGKAVGFMGQIVSYANAIPGLGNGMLGTVEDLKNHDSDKGSGWIADAIEGGTWGLMMGDRGNFSVGKDLMVKVEAAKRDAKLAAEEAARQAQEMIGIEGHLLKGFGDDLTPVGKLFGEVDSELQHRRDEYLKQAAEEWKQAHAKILAAITKEVKADGDALVKMLEADAAENAARARGEGTPGYHFSDGNDVTGRAEARRRLGIEDPRDLMNPTNEGAFPHAAAAPDAVAGEFGINAPKLDQLVKIAQTLTQIDEATKTITRDAHGELLKKLFGPTDQFALYQEGFKGIADAFAQGMTAMVTGADSFGHAFKKALGGMLHGLAMKEYAMGATEELEALASLFLLEPGMAAQHAGAGALYIGAGVGLDLIASELGYSAAGGGGTSSAFGKGGGAAGGGNALARGTSAVPTNQPVHTGSNVFIVYGDTFYDSVYGRQTKAQQIVDTALGGPGVSPR